MEFFVIKVKSEKLFYQADNEIGDYLDTTPALLSESEALLIIDCLDGICDIQTDKAYKYSDLEIKKVELTIYD